MDEEGVIFISLGCFLFAREPTSMIWSLQLLCRIVYKVHHLHPEAYRKDLSGKIHCSKSTFTNRDAEKLNQYQALTQIARLVVRDTELQQGRGSEF